jgi:hypothetical protein
MILLFILILQGRDFFLAYFSKFLLMILVFMICILASIIGTLVRKGGD